MWHGKEPSHKTSIICIYKKNPKTKGKFAIFFFYELTIKEKFKFRKMLKDNSLKDIFSVNHLITLKKKQKKQAAIQYTSVAETCLHEMHVSKC